MTLEHSIRVCIESAYKMKKKIIIYPFGEVGIKVKNCMNVCYGIQEDMIIDNNLCKYNPQIRDVSILGTINTNDYVVLLACTNEDVYDELKFSLLEYFFVEDIVELPIVKERRERKEQNEKARLRRKNYITLVGKYSYGPLCKNHRYIKSIGAFCSFAEGADVVLNHPLEYITTHPFIYAGKIVEEVENEYIDYKEMPWYFPNVEPKTQKKINKRITIGNDVWLGRNVIITNGANIGNGVIAGAGAVITKDVPDYAIVAGVPARIIRYRYTPEQIEKLNKIAWWDWPDEQIRERYDDFYLDIESFLDKYWTIALVNKK